MRDMKIELLLVGTFILLMFTLFDFTYCLIIHNVISAQYSLTYKIIIVLIPILFAISIIYKIINRNESFKDILFDAYTPLLFWAIIISIAIPASLVFAGICEGIMLLI